MDVWDGVEDLDWQEEDPEALRRIMSRPPDGITWPSAHLVPTDDDADWREKWIEAVEKVAKEMVRQASEVTQDDLELTE